MTSQAIIDPFWLVGTTLDGQFRVDKVVGEGGFGVVYRGHHLGLDQPIAIKVLKGLDAADADVHEHLFTKFREEARLLYTLSQSSLNIVRAISFGAVNTPAGVWAPYMILEWLDGRSLSDDLGERRSRGMRGRSVDETLALLQPAAEGLSIAHKSRVAHRDIKPANFFLHHRAGGVHLKVLDFGIAKIMKDGEAAGTRGTFASFTWLYAAPEQLDPRLGATGLATDVYAFALTLTEVLTDRPPVEGRDVVALLKSATDPTLRPTPRTRGANVPDAFEVACRRALAVDPNARFSTIDEFWSALSGTRGAPVVTGAMPASRVSDNPALAPAIVQSAPTNLPRSSHNAPPPHPSPPLHTPPPYATPFTNVPMSAMPLAGAAPMVPIAPMAPPAPTSPPAWAPPPGQTGTFGARPRVLVANHDGSTSLYIAIAILLGICVLFVGSCAALAAACG